jgi:hypothetical protein
VLSQALDGGHEDVVVAQEVLQDELRKGVAKTRVLVRILKVIQQKFRKI